MKLAHLRARSLVALATLVFVLGGAAAQGQRPQGGGGAPVAIDFTAVTADGKPVTDLNPADVTIKIGGKLRTIASLVLKKTEAPAAAAPAAPTAAPEAAGPTPPFFTNDAKAVVAAAAPAAPGRAFILVIDADSLQAGTEPQIRQAIEGLLKGLTPADRVSFSLAPRDTAQVWMTNDFARVRAAVTAFTAQGKANATTADALCRSRDSLVFLQGLMERLIGSETPTQVLFIGATLSTPNQASSSTVGSCEVTKDHYQAVVDTAAASRANVVVVQADAGALGRDSGLENLAGVNDAGAVMRVVGDGFAPRVLSDASAYWLATLAPDPSDRPGQPQRVDLKAVRAGVTVHTRPEMAIAKTVAPAAAPAAAKPGTASLKDMISSQAAYTDLQLRALAYPSRGKLDKMVVLVFAEPVDPAVKIKEMSVGYFDSTNKGASVIPPQIATYPIATPLQVGAGQYRIRVAATDTTGKSGAVDVMVNTTLTTAGPLRLGGMLLGAMTPDKGLVPRLTFGPDDKLTAFLEMYGQITGGIEVHFEVAATDTGPAIEGLNAIKAAGGATEEADKFNINAEIPTAKLAPGDYVVRAHVKMAGEPEGRVIRTFRKIAK